MTLTIKTIKLGNNTRFICLIFIVTSCATTKIDKERCKDIYGYFTKAKDCLALKFENSNPKKYQEYKALHSVVLKTIANQVYENKINNDQAWAIYDDIILEFNKSKNKTEYFNSYFTEFDLIKQSYSLSIHKNFHKKLKSAVLFSVSRRFRGRRGYKL